MEKSLMDRYFKETNNRMTMYEYNSIIGNRGMHTILLNNNKTLNYIQ